METNVKTRKEQIKNLLNSPGFHSFYATLLAIGLGLLVGFVVLLITDPRYAFGGFSSILFRGFRRLPDVIYFSIPIIMTGLAVGFAFKMGLFNIGASGQYTLGMFFAMYVGFMWTSLGAVHWLVAVIAGMIGGMIMGAIPGILKAFFNVNEVITSIMLNYIGMYMVDMMIKNNGIMFNHSQSRTRYLPDSVQLQSLGITGSSLNIAIFIAIGLAIVLYIVLSKTTFGYELIATGHNKDASQYAGMNQKRNTILAMLISGGLAGLGGAFMILAPTSLSGGSMTYEPINVIAANGFNGIAVALLGSSHPIGILFSATFISHIQRGGTGLTVYGYSPEVIDIVIAIIIYFSAFSLIIGSAFGKVFKKMFKGKDKKTPPEDEPQILESKEA